MKNIKLKILIILALCSYQMNANWHINNKVTFNLDEAYHENWVKDVATNYIITSAYFLGRYNFSANDFKWENTVDFGYGLYLTDFQDVLGNKSEDKLNFTSSLNYKMIDELNYNFNFDLKSQWSETFKDNALTSNFFSPLYLMASLGATYSKKEYSVLFSPLTAKMLYVGDERLWNQGLFGLADNEHINYNFGAYAKFNLISWKVADNITADGKFELFYNYAKPLKNMTENFELTLNLKVNKWLSAFFQTYLIFDKNIIDKLQFKQRFGLMSVIQLYDSDKKNKKNKTE
ncbi:MAG: DUF3078 domain-containing protein [Ignavibacteria bacterium]|nr:DUF3078 domain-containing protein [Ignavibacteria bacterium]